ncbi:MAG: hypothetical protein AAFV07_01310 [Bacteroidota bacterium]
MVKNPWLFCITLALIAFTYACAPEKSTEQEASEPQTTEEAPKAITLTPLEGSQDFPEASLELVSAAPAEEDGYGFEFAVEGYTLGEQTGPAATLGLANSGKGQHIHFIVDNGPYSAHYVPKFTTDKLDEPANHVVLAFLSRSYHESVKNMNDPKSFVVTQINTGEDVEAAADLTAPHMFYSRPKGTYKGADIDKLLLDFFLLNVDLSTDGYKVRATINGQEFLLTEWKPYVIEGLEPGEVTVKLELMDAAGEIVPGPFNVVERTVTLAAAVEQ